MALVLPVLLTVLLGLLEMSLSILRQNSLSECARRGARAAAVRGQKSTTPLGPVAWSGTAAENHAVSATIRELLTTMPPEQVQVAVSWPDASNRAGRSVQVRVSYTHDSVFASWFGSGSLSLSSTSTLQIAN